MAKKKGKKEPVKLNETVICECEIHRIVFVIPIFFTSLIIISMLLQIKTINDILLLPVCCIVYISLILGIPYLVIKSRKLILTNKRIYGKTGIIRTKSLSAPISKIQTVDIKTGVFGEIFGYSTLTIHCITGVYRFKKLSNAQEMQNAIFNQIE